jgi:hypothetical protein
MTGMHIKLLVGYGKSPSGQRHAETQIAKFELQGGCGTSPRNQGKYQT